MSSKTRSLNPSNDPIDQIINNYIEGEINQSILKDLFDNDTDKLIYGVLKELRRQNPNVKDSENQDNETIEQPVYRVSNIITVNNDSFDEKDNYIDVKEDLGYDGILNTLIFFFHTEHFYVSLSTDKVNNGAIPISKDVNSFTLKHPNLNAEKIYYKKHTNKTDFCVLGLP